MSAPTIESTEAVKLRLDAEARLEAGSAPSMKGWSVGINALGSLHQLASTPENAVDALKLLHELQVYQVELDLQHEQMESTQRELAEDLARYRGLYEHAPVGYINLSPQRTIRECNIAGASLLRARQDELRGSKLDTLLAPGSRPMLVELLKRVRPGGPSDACEVQIGAGKDSCKVQLFVSATPSGGSFLVVLVDLKDRS